MKRLPPAIQEKQRYLRLQVHSEEDFSTGEVVDAVWRASLDYLGSKGSSQADFWVMGNRYNEEDQEGVVRVNRDRQDDFRAALTMIDEIGGETAFVEITDVSGTIKSLKERD